MNLPAGAARHRRKQSEDAVTQENKSPAIMGNVSAFLNKISRFCLLFSGGSGL